MPYYSGKFRKSLDLVHSWSDNIFERWLLRCSEVQYLCGYSGTKVLENWTVEYAIAYAIIKDKVL